MGVESAKNGKYYSLTTSEFRKFLKKLLIKMGKFMAKLRKSFGSRKLTGADPAFLTRGKT